MRMDITTAFKECVARNRKTQEDLRNITGGDKQDGGQPPKTVLHSSKSKVFPGKKSEHFVRAKEISNNITKLRNFLKENRTAYVNVGASKQVAASVSGAFYNRDMYASPRMEAMSALQVMSDKSRDSLDNDVQMIIQNCQKQLTDFQVHVESSDQVQMQPQLRTHLENVLNSLASYLKRVTQLYSEMRAIRVKRTVDYQAMSKLTTHPTSSRGLKSSKSALRNATANSSSTASPSSSSSASSSRKKFSEWDGPPPRPASISSETDGNSILSTGSNITEAETPVPTYFDDEDDVISPEELQVLEQENAALFNDLNTLSQEVEQIESSVVQIAQMQEIFTEKVLQQEKEIDKLGTLIVNTSENIIGGNEQVRQAIQNSADFRAWVLFFLVVMSFSLLFLDWYND